MKRNKKKSWLTDDQFVNRHPGQEGREIVLNFLLLEIKSRCDRQNVLVDVINLCR